MAKQKAPPPPPPEPPADLSERAQELWRQVVTPYDPPRRLAAILEALRFLDRAEAARQEIARQGMTTGSGTMIHVHPLVKVERENRAAFMRWWTHLGFHTRPHPTGGML